MKPFCSNPLCLFHSKEVPDDQVEFDLVAPSGHTVTMERILLAYKKIDKSFWFCNSCANAIKMVVTGESADPDPNLGLNIQQPDAPDIPGFIFPH